MLTLLHKKIISTTIDDARWLQGESLMSLLEEESKFAFGKKLRIYFDDQTYLDVEPVADRDGDYMIGCRLGTWVDNDGTIEVTD